MLQDRPRKPLAPLPQENVCLPPEREPKTELHTRHPWECWMVLTAPAVTHRKGGARHKANTLPENKAPTGLWSTRTPIPRTLTSGSRPDAPPISLFEGDRKCCSKSGLITHLGTRQTSSNASRISKPAFLSRIPLGQECQPLGSRLGTVFSLSERPGSGSGVLCSDIAPAHHRLLDAQSRLSRLALEDPPVSREDVP